MQRDAWFETDLDIQCADDRAVRDRLVELTLALEMCRWQQERLKSDEAEILNMIHALRTGEYDVEEAEYREER